jgi:thioredoxin reductase (NADPH)
MRAQAERFGAEIIDKDVREIDLSGKIFKVEGKQTEVVIITTGAESIPLGVPGEAQYIGRGVSYCAVCDAAFFKEKRVFVVGGGDAAMEDTLALTKFAKKITIIHRRDQFRASKIMQARVLARTDKVDVLWNSEIVGVEGDGMKIKQIKIKNLLTKEINEAETEGLFVAIGHKPATDFLKDQLQLDEKKYVKTGINYGGADWRQGYPTMTSVPGVFAAGDNVDFRYRQAVSAAGMGVMAALDAERWLELNN